MSRYCKVSTRMWGDEWFRSLSAPQPNAQTLWTYLLTGPHTNNAIPGLFMVGEAGMAEALGWPLKGFREAFQEVFAKGKAKADWNARVVWLPKALAYNAPESPNVVRSWGKFFSELPECALKAEAFRSLKVFIEGLSKGFREAFQEAFAEPLANHEHEHEHEHEEKPLLSPPSEARTALLPDDADAVEAEAVEAPQDPARPAAPARRLNLVKLEPAEFAAFYEAYPKKMARADALRAWVKLKPDAALVVQIMAAVEAQQVLGEAPGNTLAPIKGRTYIPYPASWLTGKRWTDEIAPRVVPTRPAPTSGINPGLTTWGDEPKRSAP